MKRLALGAVVGLALGAAGGAALATQVRAPTVLGLADAVVTSPPSGKASIAALAQGENAFIGRLTLAPGGAVPTHRDATEEYIHVLAGGGVLTIDGVEHALAPGHTVYMPAQAEVSYANGDEELVAIQVFAGPEPAAKYQSWEPIAP